MVFAGSYRPHPGGVLRAGRRSRAGTARRRAGHRMAARGDRPALGWSGPGARRGGEEAVAGGAESLLTIAFIDIAQFASAAIAKLVMKAIQCPGTRCRFCGYCVKALLLSLIHISEPTRLGMISYAVF